MFGMKFSRFFLVINRRTMAVFNKRQVGYIKAIAGVGNHKTMRHSRATGDLAASVSLDSTNSRVDNSVKKMKGLTIFLNRGMRCVDSADTGDPNTWNPAVVNSVSGFRSTSFSPGLDCMFVDSVDEGDEGKTVTTDQRVGEDFYLNATHVKMRFTMPDFGSISGTVQPHHEYRLIIFRNRLPTVTDYSLNDAIDNQSYLNFHYDLFNGYVGRRIGLQGYRKHEEYDGDNFYSGNVVSGTLYTTTGGTAKSPTSEPANLSPDDWMTLPLNDTDYVIHTDERFFLGREHGKSHYEKVIRFDWRERGSTHDSDMQNGLREGFNPNWVIMLLATTNDDVEPNINYHVTQVTSVESA